VVGEGRRDVPVRIRQRDPQLRAVQDARVLGRRLLGVRDALPGGHQRELARPDAGVAAQRVAVVDLALEQPGDGLQAGVRVRRHLHPGGGGDVVGAVVVDERPRADQPAPERGEQAAHVGALPEQDLLAGQQVQRRAGRGALQAAEFTGRWTAVEVAHGFPPRGGVGQRGSGACGQRSAATSHPARRAPAA
jgi:hypothetical protein